MKVQIPIYLTAEMVAKAALPLLDAGKLGRQIYDHMTPCRYRMGGQAPCVIGAALSDEDAAYLDSRFYGGGISNPIVAGAVVCPAHDIAWICAAQRMHDAGWIDDLRQHLMQKVSD